MTSNETVTSIAINFHVRFRKFIFNRLFRIVKSYFYIFKQVFCGVFFRKVTTPEIKNLPTHNSILRQAKEPVICQYYYQHHQKVYGRKLCIFFPKEKVKIGLGYFFLIEQNSDNVPTSRVLKNEVKKYSSLPLTKTMNIL